MTSPDAWTPPAADVPPREAARCWFLRMQSGEATPEDIASLRRWLEADPAQRLAFSRACEAWETLDEMRSFMTDLYGAEPSRVSSRRIATAAARWKSPWLATAAAILVAIFVGLIYARDADITTAEGEVRMMKLPDGTTIWLDTASALNLHYTATERRIELVRGEAWFDVEPDRARPFVVDALDSRTTDIGTFFGVRRSGKAIDVGVQRGTVRVAWRRHDLTLNAGQATRFGASTESMPTLPFDAAAIAWQSGRLFFRGTPLREVLQEMDRYRPGRIVLIGDGAANRAVSAALWINDLDSGLDALAATQGVRITRLTRYLVIVTDAGASAPAGG